MAPVFFLIYKYTVNLVLSNDERFAIDLCQTFTQDIVQQWFKHLQHVDIPWRPWEYLPWATLTPWNQIVQAMTNLASNVGIMVETDRLTDQKYLNWLHKFYEKAYDGRQEWTDFHELIHVIEFAKDGPPSARKIRPRLEINYRHKAGLLKKPFRFSWLENGISNVAKGTVYLAWDELGKTPYTYFLDQEPDDTTRFLELAKPWIWLRPKIHIALDNHNVRPIAALHWNEWYEKKQPLLCDKYQIPHWSLQDMTKVLPIGTLQEIDRLDACIIQGHSPKRIIIDTSLIVL